MATVRISIDDNITDQKVRDALDALKCALDDAGAAYEWARNMPRGTKVGPVPMPTWDIDPGIRQPVPMPGLHREIPPGTVWCGTTGTASAGSGTAINGGG